MNTREITWAVLVCVFLYLASHGLCVGSFKYVSINFQFETLNFFNVVKV